LETISEIDRALLIAINGFHFGWLDQIMIFFSNKFVWFPFYGWIIYLIFKQNTVKSSLLALLLIAVGITLSDQTTSALLKPLFQRLRPCHVLDLQALLNLPDGCGGAFGFASSHAANSMFVAFFCISIMPQNIFLHKIFIPWVIMMGWSRVYLAAHYPGDVFFGWLLGAFYAWLLFRAWKFANKTCALGRL